MTTGDFQYNQKVRDSSIVRREISLGQPEVMGLQVLVGGVLTDPVSINAKIYQELNFDDGDPDGSLLATYVYGVGSELVKESTGVYSFVLQPELTSVRGEFMIVWTYVVGSHTYVYNDYYIVLEYMPVYDSLLEGEKMVVQQISWMLGDLFDNTVGGTPYFEGEFQTHYGYERIAQLMFIAVNKVNITKQPMTNFRVGPPNAGGGGAFPNKAYGLLQYATYVEVLRHFIRSYVEQPTIQGANVSFADRRDYMQRWQSVLADEKETYADMLRQFKRSYLNLGAGNLIVAGGLYGGGNRRFVYGAYASSMRAARFYPQSFAIGGTG